MQCILPITAIEPTQSVTINISLKTVMKRPNDFPGKPCCLQPTSDIDYPACAFFVLPKIMDTNIACSFTAIAYAVREPGRPPGNYTTFTPSSHHRHDKTIETIHSHSNVRMKTNPNQAQVEHKYTVWLIWLISRISISFQMILNNLIWSLSTSLKRRRAILLKNYSLFSNGI